MMNSQYNLPEAFLQRFHENYSFAPTVIDQLDVPSPVSVRLHPAKKIKNISFTSNVLWCENGVYLDERPLYTLDPNFHGGAYYPQEAASMYLSCILDSISINEQAIILDACAAPGGKSSIIAEKLNNKGVLISNEIIKSRAKILVETSTKWGYSNQIITSNDTKSFKKIAIPFDVIVVDAPCSGEGMFRKDQKSRTEWSIANCDLCVTRQKEILSNLIPCLSNNGYLIYSTCTFNPDENENLLLKIIEEHDLEVCEMPLFDGMIKDGEGIGQYFFPGITKSEGFYCAVLKKKNTFSSPYKMNEKIENISPPNFIEEHHSEIIYFQDNDLLYACNSLTYSVSIKLNKHLFILKKGIEIAHQFGKKLVPKIDLALTPFIHTNFETIELDKEVSLKYLRGETFPLVSTPGFKKISFENLPIGIINHLGNRFNNLYPSDWRIKMKIT